MKNINLGYIGLAAIAIICTMMLLSSCDDTIIPDEKTCDAYHSKTMAKEEKLPTANDSLNVYIDYSDGMPIAIQACGDFVKWVISHSDAPTSKYYKVGKGVEFMGAGIKIYAPNAPQINPTNPENFREHSSDLDEALHQIIANKTQTSLFITDFELYKNGPDGSPWATRDFTEWFNAKGSVDVFAKPFTNAQGETQHLYILIFTPQAVLRNDSLQSIRYHLQKAGYMDESSKDDVVWMNAGWGYNHLTTEDGKDNLNPSFAPLNTFGIPAHQWSYFNLDYSDVSEVLTDATVPKKQKYLFNNLKFTSEGAAFQNPTFSLRVQDITESFATQKEGDVVTDVFDYQFNEATKEVQITLKDAFLKKQGGALSKNPQAFKVELWLTEVQSPKNYADAEEVLEWTASNGTKITSLHDGLLIPMEAKFPESCLHTFYIEFKN